MSRNIALYLKDILDNMEHTEKFLENMSYDEFASDLKTSYAVVRGIEIIGEATKNIPSTIRRKYPAIPWKEMAGMRDKVIHFYFGVNPKIDDYSPDEVFINGDAFYPKGYKVIETEFKALMGA